MDSVSGAQTLCAKPWLEKRFGVSGSGFWGGHVLVDVRGPKVQEDVEEEANVYADLAAKSKGGGQG